MNDEKDPRYVAKVSRAKLLQTLEELEVAQFDAAKDAAHKRNASLDADNRLEAIRCDVTKAKAALAGAIELIK